MTQPLPATNEARAHSRRLWPRAGCVALVAAVGLLSSGLVVTGGSAAASAAGARPWAGRTIQLGAIFSTTGTGTAYGPQQVKGAKLAVRQINAAGGVRGAKIRLTIVNDGSVPATAASKMRALITKGKVVAVLGPTFSNSAAAADPVADSLATPVLAVSNTGPGIVGQCAYPCTWIFRDSLGEATSLPANIDTYVARAHPKSASVLYPATDPFAASTAAIGTQALTADGVDVPTPVVVPDPTQPTASVAQALAGNPSVVVVTSSSATAAAEIVKALRTQGFRGQILGGNAFNSKSVAETAGSADTGTQSAAAWFVGNPSKVNRSFVAAYRTRYGSAPDQFAALAYTGVELLATAAGSARLGFTSVAHDRAALKASLATVRVNTPLGRFQFTADHDVDQPIWIVAATNGGGYRLVKVLPRSASTAPVVPR
jgi:branched-chain amino acid transport system substrate-binding protein